VKEVFKGVNIDHPESGEFQSHAVRILNALDMVINLLDDPPALKEALDHLAHQHGEQEGVTKEHFKVSGRIFHGTIPRHLHSEIRHPLSKTRLLHRATIFVVALCNSGDHYMFAM